MTRVLAIVFKDARHLWPYIGAYVALLVLSAVLDPAYTHQDPTTYNLVSSLLPIACWFLIVALIHEEKVPGDRQYWLTRPISRWQLVEAKLLFIVAFIQLPLLVSQAGVMAVLGIPPGPHISTLLWKQVFFFAFYVLPAAGMAAITRNIGQVLLTGLALFLPAIGLQGVLFTRFRLAVGGVEWILSTVVAVMVAVAAIVIFGIQYSQRKTALARVVAGVAALSTVAAGALPLDRIHKETASPVRITMDSNLGPGGVGLGVGRNRTAVEVPVVVEGLNPDMEFVNHTMAIEVSGAGIPTWRGQFPEGGLHHLDHGRGWITLPIDGDVMRAARKTTVDLTGALELNLFGDRRVYPAPGGGRVAVDGVGVCVPDTDSLGSLAIVCYSPFPHTSLYYGPPGGGANWIIPRGLASAPFPVSAGFQAVSRYTTQLPFRSWTENPDSRLVTTRLIGRARANFEFRGIDLWKIARWRR